MKNLNDLPIPEIAYKRGLDNNYMIIKGDENTITEWNNNYKLKMMVENSIDNVIKLEMKMSEGMYDYYYEISGKQPLSRLFENRVIKGPDLINIIKGINKAYESAYEYMLPPDHFIVDARFIYMDVETKDMEFLYYPLYEMHFEESLIKLAEYILDKVDHQDSYAVMLAYKFYKTVRAGNFVMKDIDRILEDGSKADLCKKEDLSDKEEPLDINIISNDIIDNALEETSIIDNRPQNKKFSLAGIFSMGKLKDKKQDKKKEVFEFEDDEDEFESFDITGHNGDTLYKEGTTARDSADILRDINTEDSVKINKPEVYGKTVMFVSEEEMSSHVLIQKGKSKDVIHELESFPVSIGKVSSLVDIVLKDPSVSKLHAQIIKEDEKILIKDCNSTNGTFVNGFQLDAEETIDLEPGDEIRLGKVIIEYR